MWKVLVFALFFNVYQAAITLDNKWFDWAGISGSFLQDEPNDYPGPIFSEGIRTNGENAVFYTQIRSKDEPNIEGETTTEGECIEIITEGVKQTTIKTELETVAQNEAQIKEKNDKNVANLGEAIAEDSGKTGEQSEDEQPKETIQDEGQTEDSAQDEEQENNNVADGSQDEENNSNDAEEEYGSNKIDDNAKGDKSDEIKVEKKNYKYKNYYNEYKKKAADARRKKLEDLEMLRKDLQEKYGRWKKFNCLSHKCSLECIQNGNYGGFCNGGVSGSCQCL